MNALKALAPYAFVLACIVTFVPLPVWSANTIGFLALVNPEPEPEPEPPPKAFDDDDAFDAAFAEWVTKHRDQGRWTRKHETRPGRFFLSTSCRTHETSLAQKNSRRKFLMLGWRTTSTLTRKT
jgi:hypothetical protein